MTLEYTIEEYGSIAAIRFAIAIHGSGDELPHVYKDSNDTELAWMDFVQEHRDDILRRDSPAGDRSQFINGFVAGWERLRDVLRLLYPSPTPLQRALGLARESFVFCHTHGFGWENACSPCNDERYYARQQAITDQPGTAGHI